MGMKATPRNGGFTLIEILIALVVLAIGLAGMVPSLVGSFRGNRFGIRTTQTATFSQDKLEELRRTPFETLRPLCGTASTDSPRPGMTRRWTITEAGGGACNTAEILVIEVCTADDAVFSQACVSLPKPSHHFLAVRANL